LTLYIAAADYQPDRDAPSGNDFSELQAAFIRHIKAAGLHYTPFSNRDQLRAEILKEPWPEKPRAKPIVLPYASLGSLFKGREAFLRRLRQSLTHADGGTTAIVSKALYGLGGVGKTRAAVEYAWAYREDYTYRPARPRSCSATWRVSPGPCCCRSAKRPRKKCGCTPCSPGLWPIPVGS
jgi:hypothetical protein